MEFVTMATIGGAIAAIFAAYHTAVVVPRDKDTSAIKERLRAVEGDTVRLQTEVSILSVLPKQMSELVDAINSLKVEIAHIKK